MIHAGVIKSIWRYPVKSMRGEALESCEVYWYGIEGDRRYAYVRGDADSNFPWLTARQVPQMLAFAPQLRSPADPLDSPVDVAMPDGTILPIHSDQLRESMQSYYGGPVHLMQLRRGAYDAMAISIISLGTVEHLARSNDPRRFRANVVVELSDPSAFAEDRWIGSHLRVGERADAVRFRVLRPTKRCKMICIDPDTQAVDPAYLQRTVDQHDACAGVYAVPESTGTISAGDTIYLVNERR